MNKIYKITILLGVIVSWISPDSHISAQVFDGAEPTYDYYDYKGEKKPYRPYGSELSENVNSDGTTKEGTSFGEPIGLSSEDSALQDIEYYSPPSYDFEYQVHGGGNNHGHSESRMNTETSGKYFVDLPNGLRQIVVYTADVNGFHPTITYEPISENSIDNNVSINRFNNNNIQSNANAYTEEKHELVEQYGGSGSPAKFRRRRKLRKVHDVRYKGFPEFGLRIRN